MAGIYIHIPFCKKACHYCNFHFSTSLKYKENVIEAIQKEINLQKNYLGREIIESIYFGGGTPSILSEHEISGILNAIEANFTLSKDVEITFECNPDDMKRGKIIALKNNGVNRLSIGIQSFFDDDLKYLNRAHNSNEASNCVKLARDLGFDNLTIDLIYGIPTLSNEKWIKNLQQTFELKVDHISAYCLTIEKNTALFKLIEQKKYQDIDEDICHAQFEILCHETNLKGYKQYEISNFAKAGKVSIHNSNYWNGKKYLGVGPSAHSFNLLERSWNISNNVKYYKAMEDNNIPCETEILSKKNQFNEFVMTGLRTMWGCSLEEIENKFGAEFRIHIDKKAEKYINSDLMLRESGKLVLTQKGKFYADGIASALFLL